MNLRRSIDGLGKLLGQSQPEPQPAADPQEITARIARKHRAATAADEALAATLLELWRQVSARLAGAQDPEARLAATRMVELDERLRALPSGALPDLDTCRGMLAALAEVVPERLDGLDERVRALADGTREYQRRVGQTDLAASHLRDELDRCRTLIDQECARRGMAHVAGDPHDLHSRLARLLEADAPALPANGVSDPIIAALERIMVSNDADALRNLPDWVKRPAVRILELVAERNRYRRLLEHAGMLPPPDRRPPAG